MTEEIKTFYVLHKSCTNQDEIYGNNLISGCNNLIFHAILLLFIHIIFI